MIAILLSGVLVYIFIRMAIRNFHRMKQREIDEYRLNKHLEDGKISQKEYEKAMRALD